MQSVDKRQEIREGDKSLDKPKVTRIEDDRYSWLHMKAKVMGMKEEDFESVHNAGSLRENGNQQEDFIY